MQDVFTQLDALVFLSLSGKLSRSHFRLWFREIVIFRFGDYPDEMEFQPSWIILDLSIFRKFSCVSVEMSNYCLMRKENGK